MNLVTGGAGYIGSHFIKKYLTLYPDAEIVAVDNLSEGHEQALGFSPNIHFVKQDIGDTEAMIAIFKKFNVKTVIHFAASCYVGESQEKPAKYFQNNVIQTLNMLNAMEACDIKRMVFSSTCATYGDPDYTPIDENHPQRPINVYGSTKLMTEQALRAYAIAQGWSYVALRYFNASGADESGLIGEHHDPETHLIPLVLQVALGQRSHITIFGDDYPTPDGTCIRDYVHVDDLASAHLAALEQLGPGVAFKLNLGTGRGASVREVIEACRRVTGHAIPAEVGLRRPGDPPELVADSTRAQSELSWRPQYNDIESIVRTAWGWHSKHPRGYGS